MDPPRGRVLLDGVDLRDGPVLVAARAGRAGPAGGLPRSTTRSRANIAWGAARAPTTATVAPGADRARPARLGARPAARPRRPRSASAASRCRRGSASSSRWPAPTSPTPTCWCSTRRPPRSTRPPRCGSQRALDGVTRGRTSVAIAHRLVHRRGRRPGGRRRRRRGRRRRPARRAAQPLRGLPAAARELGAPSSGRDRPAGGPAAAGTARMAWTDVAACTRIAGTAPRPAVAARLKRDADGLVCAVVQQHDTREVLMVGWMDDEALHRTLTTGRVTFWSRSRQEYWRKGDTSGHVQWVRGVALDCDGDALLVTVDQVGAACHTGDRTCFDAGALDARRRHGRNRPVTADVAAAAGTEHAAPGPHAVPDLTSASPGRSLDDLPGAGAGPPGHPRRPALPRRRRDADRGLPQAGRRPARARFLLESAEHGAVVALEHRRGRAAAPRSPRATARRTGSGSRRSACRRAATRCSPCGTPSPRCRRRGCPACRR